MRWWEQYHGKPWRRIPDPPHSYTCGEVVRSAFLERLGIDMLPVYADPGVLRQCVSNMDDPSLYGLRPFEGAPRPFDVAFLCRAQRRDHVGLAVETSVGLMLLHCQQGVGVTLDSPAELLGVGFRKIEWFRHKDVSRELALCRA